MTYENIGAIVLTANGSIHTVCLTEQEAENTVEKLNAIEAVYADLESAGMVEYYFNEWQSALAKSA